jgi:predicted lipoprotein with Yx(FWY)xxD motif
MATSALAQPTQLVNGRGMTLYVYDRDTPSRSMCDEQCAVEWPPFLAASDASTSGDWSVDTRDDGNKQWAYKGRPLYTSVKDQKAGDTNGDGGVWHVAKP